MQGEERKQEKKAGKAWGHGCSLVGRLEGKGPSQGLPVKKGSTGEGQGPCRVCAG